MNIINSWIEFIEYLRTANCNRWAFLLLTLLHLIVWFRNLCARFVWIWSNIQSKHLVPTYFAGDHCRWAISLYQKPAVNPRSDQQSIATLWSNLKKLSLMDQSCTLWADCVTLFRNCWEEWLSVQSQNSRCPKCNTNMQALAWFLNS